MVNLSVLLKAENQNPIQIQVFSQNIKLLNALSTFFSFPVLFFNSFYKSEQPKEKSQGLKLFSILSKEEVR